MHRGQFCINFLFFYFFFGGGGEGGGGGARCVSCVYSYAVIRLVILVLIQIGNLDNIYLFELVPPVSSDGNSLQSVKEVTSSDTTFQPPRVTLEERLKHEAGVCG